jgi:membrane-bound serine protease (ClpP class)
LCLLLAALVAACGEPSDTVASIEVVRVSGYLDDARLRYIDDSIANAQAAGRDLIILQVDSPAVVASDVAEARTTAIIADPPLPLVTWVGPTPARAANGVDEIVAASPLLAIAPGSAPNLAADLQSPTLRQLVQELDGVSIGSFPPLDTITEDLPDDQEGVTTAPVTFTQPGLWHRFTHLGAAPESAFFFLVMGLTLAAFEFFALGPGLAAAVAAVSLFLGSYGISILPVNPSAVALAVISIWLLAVSYQKGGLAVVNLIGAGLLTWSGFSFSADPAVRPAPFGVVFALVCVMFFFLLALPAVGRARFSTRTIGREGLIGQVGSADADFGPDGVVVINGARWPATAHREAGIKTGDRVVVTAVAGRELEVEKAAS